MATNTSKLLFLDAYQRCLAQSRIKKEVNRVGIYSKEQEVFIYGFSIRIVKNKDGTKKHQRLHNYSDQLNIFKIVIVSHLIIKNKETVPIYETVSSYTLSIIAMSA